MYILKQPSQEPTGTQYNYFSRHKTLEVVLAHIAQVVKLIHLTPLKARKDSTLT